jgi:hypothetical protein
MYIGRQPIIGNFVKLDTITTSATTTFNLLNGGVAYYPQSANNCLVSLNGILQAPTDSYTISGSTIVFSSALTTSDVIDFIIVLGDVLNIGTPSDNTVSLAKLTATGTKNSTTFLRGDNTFASAGGVNTPNFSAKISANQTISHDTVTLIAFDTEQFDTDSAYTNTSTNYKFTVPSGKAGKYLVNASLRINNVTTNRFFFLIYKNGSDIQPFENGTKAFTSVSGSIVLDLAVGDYIQIYGYQDSGSSQAVRPDASIFQMFKLIE